MKATQMNLFDDNLNENHDAIMQRMDIERLKEILKPVVSSYFGTKGVWSKYHCSMKDLDEWTDDEKRLVEQAVCRDCNVHMSWENLVRDGYIKRIIGGYREDREEIESLNEDEVLEFDITYEYPLIQNNKGYVRTIGFADIIVHVSQNVDTVYCRAYSPTKDLQIFIEVKTKNDWKNGGRIMRQIREYKEYYNNNWVKRYMEYEGEEMPAMRYVVLTDVQVLQNTINMFLNEGIRIININNEGTRAEHGED